MFKFKHTALAERGAILEQGVYMQKPLLLEIKGNSLDDGPGIRSVVFFKGCPLSCSWCHNPESKRIEAEIGFEAGECVGCNTCIASCPEGALSRDHLFFVDRSRCTLCFSCTETCPSGALRRIGNSADIDGIVADVIRDKPFFDTSGGGVTLSGGEPTLFMDYCGKLAQTLREKGVHLLLETCGLFDFPKFEALLYPYLDAIYFDIKLIDSAAHARNCGVPNGRILDNFKKLHARAAKGGIPVIPRTPLIPGITDTEENMHAIADFLVSRGATEARLLPYHPLWQEKNRTIGIAAKEGNPAMNNWLENRKVEACRSIFLQAGINL